MFGIILIVSCIVLLALNKKDSSNDELFEDYSEAQKQRFGFFAILLAIMAPFLWTGRAYFLRNALAKKAFKSTWDLAID